MVNITGGQDRPIRHRRPVRSCGELDLHLGGEISGARPFINLDRPTTQIRRPDRPVSRHHKLHPIPSVPCHPAKPCVHRHGSAAIPVGQQVSPIEEFRGCPGIIHRIVLVQDHGRIVITHRQSELQGRAGRPVAGRERHVVKSSRPLRRRSTQSLARDQQPGGSRDLAQRYRVVFRICRRRRPIVRLPLHRILCRLVGEHRGGVNHDIGRKILTHCAAEPLIGLPKSAAVAVPEGRNRVPAGVHRGVQRARGRGRIPHVFQNLVVAFPTAARPCPDRDRPQALRTILGSARENRYQLPGALGRIPQRQKVCPGLDRPGRRHPAHGIPLRHFRGLLEGAPAQPKRGQMVGAGIF